MTLPSEVRAQPRTADCRPSGPPEREEYPGSKVIWLLFSPLPPQFTERKHCRKPNRATTNNGEERRAQRPDGKAGGAPGGCSRRSLVSSHAQCSLLPNWPGHVYSLDCLRSFWVRIRKIRNDLSPKEIRFSTELRIPNQQPRFEKET